MSSLRTPRRTNESSPYSATGNQGIPLNLPRHKASSQISLPKLASPTMTQAVRMGSLRRASQALNSMTKQERQTASWQMVGRPTRARLLEGHKLRTSLSRRISEYTGVQFKASQETSSTTRRRSRRRRTTTSGGWARTTTTPGSRSSLIRKRRLEQLRYYSELVKGLNSDKL